MGQPQCVMGEASCPAPGPARSTPHLLPTGSPLQLTFSRSSSSSSTMSRRLFTARFDSFSCGKKTVCAHTNVGPRPHSAGRGGAGRGLGSHLGQLVILVVEGEGPELGAVPVLLLVRPRPAHLQRHHAASAPPPSRPVPSRPVPPSAAPRRRSPPRAPLPPLAAARQRHGTEGRAAAARGTPGPQSARSPPSARPRAAVGLQLLARTARAASLCWGSRCGSGARGGRGSGSGSGSRGSGLERPAERRN